MIHLINSVVLFVFLRFTYLIWEWTSERASKRERSVLVYSPNGHNSQNRVCLNPETWKLLQVSHMGERPPRTWAIFFCFPRLLAESLIKRRATGTWTGNHMGHQHGRQRNNIQGNQTDPSPVGFMPCDFSLHVYIVKYMFKLNTCILWSI